MLVRTWNLFHGNALPPERRTFFDEMITLATADDPDVLCVQEVPVWAAIAVAPRLRVWPTSGSSLNPRGFRTGEASAARLGVVGRNAGPRNAASCRPSGSVRRRSAYLVANMHCTSLPDRRIAQAELLRAATFATSEALPDDVVVLAGDFNLTGRLLAVMRDLTGPGGDSRRPAPESTTSSFAAPTSSSPALADGTSSRRTVTCCQNMPRWRWRIT